MCASDWIPCMIVHTVADADPLLSLLSSDLVLFPFGHDPAADSTVCVNQTAWTQLLTETHGKSCWISLWTRKTIADFFQVLCILTVLRGLSKSVHEVTALIYLQHIRVSMRVTPPSRVPRPSLLCAAVGRYIISLVVGSRLSQSNVLSLLGLLWALTAPELEACLIFLCACAWYLPVSCSQCSSSRLCSLLFIWNLWNTCVACFLISSEILLEFQYYEWVLGCWWFFFCNINLLGFGWCYYIATAFQRNVALLSLRKCTIKLQMSWVKAL